MRITTIHDSRMAPGFEVIERKGRGHPDTLSDGLAEVLSQEYSQWTRQKFGAVLHHNFDKVGLLGGRSEVALGRGRLTSPVRVLLNGRATPALGDEPVPVQELLVSRAKAFLGERLPLLDADRDLTFLYNVSDGSSPGAIDDSGAPRGARATWFAPRDISDLRERDVLASNDTSVGCGYWPLTPTEEAVLTIERRLTESDEWRLTPWLGTDIKVMAVRSGNDLGLTLCIPQIAGAVDDLDAYQSNLASVRDAIVVWVDELLPEVHLSLSLNTKDDVERPELYLTAIGSSIETGDEGLVGRGNRANGLIAMHRPYSMEGVCGKNPVYHVGKLYSLLAFDLARRVGSAFGTRADAWLVGQEGRRLDDPWQVLLRTEATLQEADVRPVVEACLATLPTLTDALIAGEVEAY